MEGFCNLGNYLVYSRKPSPMASYLLKNLQDDEDPIYGVGYRNMRRKLDAQGWERHWIGRFSRFSRQDQSVKFRTPVASPYRSCLL